MPAKETISIDRTNFENIRKERERAFGKKKYSKHAIAIEIGYSDPRNLYNALSSGKIALDKMEKIAEYLNCSVDYLSRSYFCRKNETYKEYTIKKKMRAAHNDRKQLFHSLFNLFGIDESRYHEIVKSGYADALDQRALDGIEKTIYSMLPINDNIGPLTAEGSIDAFSMMKDKFERDMMLQNLFEPYNDLFANDDDYNKQLNHFRDAIAEGSQEHIKYIQRMKALTKKFNNDRLSSSEEKQTIEEMFMNYLRNENTDLFNQILWDINTKYYSITELSKGNKAPGRPTIKTRKEGKENEKE